MPGFGHQPYAVGGLARDGISTAEQPAALLRGSLVRDPCGKVGSRRFIWLAQRGGKSDHVMEEHERSVAEIVTRKLRDDDVPEQVAALILDAMRGNDPDAGVVEGGPAGGPSRVHLKSIAVEGFRGIGPMATLLLTPGPGLTVVTGRNGSGKSSFAEAAGLVLTGENKRWADRSAVWKEGWRNLHAPEDPTAISVQLTEDGVPSTTTVTRAWAGAGLESADDVVWAGPAELSLAAKGWLRPLELYRPFLSYAELGALVSGRPTSMHDAMQAILGLDLLTARKRP